MQHPVRLVAAAALAAVLFVGRRPIARLLRTIDQRAGVFAPHGARLYNAVAPRLLAPLYRRVAEDAAAVASRRAVSDVIELGSGPGELALEIARRLPEAAVVGVDLAPAMVDAATRRARDHDLADRVRFVLADAARIPLPDQTFDLAVSTLSLHHWTDPAAVFGEIARTLRPGGVALVYDLRPFTYSADELERFVAGSGFEPGRLERQLVQLGGLPALFVRIRLVRPSGG